MWYLNVILELNVSNIFSSSHNASPFFFFLIFFLDFQFVVISHMSLFRFRHSSISLVTGIISSSVSAVLSSLFLSFVYLH